MMDFKAQAEALLRSIYRVESLSYGDAEEIESILAFAASVRRQAIEDVIALIDSDENRLRRGHTLIKIIPALAVDGGESK